MENKNKQKKQFVRNKTIQQEENGRAIAGVFRGIKRDIVSIKQVQDAIKGTLENNRAYEYKK